MVYIYDVQHSQIDVHLVNVGLPNNAFDYCLFQTTLMDGCQPHRHVAKQSTKYAVCHVAKSIQFSACQCTQVANNRNHNSYNGQCTDSNSLNNTSHGPSEVNNNYVCILQE